MKVRKWYLLTELPSNTHPSRTFVTVPSLLEPRADNRRYREEEGEEEEDGDDDDGEAILAVGSAFIIVAVDRLLMATDPSINARRGLGFFAIRSLARLLVGFSC
ncbi:hypothetical protein MRB53_029029 [Persea americana]|uniref:Uncharacterized protein n=1 Tax=Persea americana TaxID=3435 RepID=A0ACC2KHR0_PERAE|nr:hypothetical protein MRB53_029029 [Persea americana]